MSHAKVIHRRRFLAAATALGAATTVPNFSRAAAIENAGLKASDFRGTLNTEFRATALSQPDLRVSVLTLTDVSAASHPHPSLDKLTAHEFAFSLKFDAKAKGLSQDTYLLSHPTLGDFVALLVPTRAGNFLRAEFHRL